MIGRGDNRRLTSVADRPRLLADIAHIPGPVATGLRPIPIDAVRITATRNPNGSPGRGGSP